MSFPFSRDPFELNADEVKLVYKANKDILDITRCQDGYMQDKGRAAEELVLGLLSLCNVETFISKRYSTLDELLKVDIVCKNLDEVGDVFAFQVKCSKTGAEQHHSKYGDEIEYESYYFRNPWCLIVDGSLSNADLLDLMIEELCLDFQMDLTRVDQMALKVYASNSKRIPKDYLGFRLSNKEEKALLYIYDIGMNKETYFLRSK